MEASSAPPRSCRICGVELDSTQFSSLCPTCFQAQSSQPTANEVWQRPAGIDPDNPGWGVGWGVATWGFSIAVSIIIPLIAVLVWLIPHFVGREGAPMSQDDIRALLEGPASLLIQVIAIIPAHLLTLVFCWAVVSKMGRRPFLESLGWEWKLESVRIPPLIAKGAFVVGTVVAVLLIEAALGKLLPQKEDTVFDMLLKSSAQVRIWLALLAVFTAPLVEEFVYRGVLYSGLRSRLGLGWTVVIVTTLFALVHFPQYWGAWAGLTGLTLLSLILTAVRARSKSILPCVAIHTLNNIVGAIQILYGGGSSQ